MDQTQTTHTRAVPLAIGVFTLAQLALLAVYGYTPYPDSEGYRLMAEALLAGGHTFYPSTADVADSDFIWNIGAINMC